MLWHTGSSYWCIAVPGINCLSPSDVTGSLTSTGWYLSVEFVAEVEKQLDILRPDEEEEEEGGRDVDRENYHSNAHHDGLDDHETVCACLCVLLMGGQVMTSNQCRAAIRYNADSSRLCFCVPTLQNCGRCRWWCSRRQLVQGSLDGFGGWPRLASWGLTRSMWHLYKHLQLFHVATVPEGDAV